MWWSFFITNPRIKALEMLMEGRQRAFVKRRLWLPPMAGMFLAFVLSGCGYHPPIADSRAAVLRLDQSHVALRVRGMPDEDIPSLASRTDLRMLFFSDGHAGMEAKITDRGLRELAGLRLPDLHLLDLGYCGKITDAGVVHVSRMHTVTRLSLMASPGVTDEGLRNLQGMKNLQQLDLRGCPRITDRGLGHLAALKNLRWVQLGGCPKVSPSGVARLQALLPIANVEKDEKEWQHHSEGGALPVSD